MIATHAPNATRNLGPHPCTMPAKLPYRAVKTDIRLWADDIAFLAPYLDARNSDVTEVTRELVHRYANNIRAQMGLPPTAPYPPGKLP